MSSLLHQGRASYAFFERNWNLTRRYLAWEIVWLVYNIVNALSVTYIGKAAQTITNTKIDTQYLILYLMIGTAVWSYLSITFEGVTDLITIERWEGTIEHTFMAPISRFTHRMFAHGRELVGHDVVIPRIGASITDYGLAVLTHFERAGVPSVNSTIAISRRAFSSWGDCRV